MYVRSSTRRGNRRIYAEDDIQMGEVAVDPEATELVFETEDVAELVAEVTGEDVEVVADEDAVTFTVGDTDYTVEAEGQEEILETSRKVLRGKRPVRANRNVRPRSGSRVSSNPARRRSVSAATRNARRYR